nr:hypothetical protein GCM10010200_050260 [Actinomadura rugatobispora]
MGLLMTASTPLAVMTDAVLRTMRGVAPGRLWSRTWDTTADAARGGIGQRVGWDAGRGIGVTTNAERTGGTWAGWWT